MKISVKEEEKCICSTNKLKNFMYMGIQIIIVLIGIYDKEVYVWHIVCQVSVVPIFLFI